MDRPNQMNAINTEMLGELLDAPRGRTRGRERPCDRDLLHRLQLAFSAGADIKEDLDDEGRVDADAAIRRPLRRGRPATPSRRSPPATATRSAAEPRSRSAVTSGSAARTFRCASRGRAGGTGRAGPTGHALRTLGGQVPAAHLAYDQGRRGLPARPGQPGGPRRGDRGHGAGDGRQDRRSTTPRRSPT